MKPLLNLSLLAALLVSTPTFAQSDPMKGMEKDKPMNDCMAMKDMKDTKGMDVKGMDAQKCADMMKGMKKESSKSPGTGPHTATAVVKAIDAGQSKVTLAHGPVKSLGWPAMTMAFAVKDKSLLDKLVVGKTVQVELQKENNEYVVTGVK